MSFAQDTFSVFYQKEQYFTGNKVKILKPLFDKTNRRVMLYLVSSFQKSLDRLSWGDSSTVETIFQIVIKSP